jgi:hypothetical protein
MPTAEDVMRAYIALWSTPDEAERRRLAEAALTEDVTVFYPAVEARGRDEVVAAIGNLHGRIPGVRFEATTGIAQHHGWLREAWRMFRGDCAVIVDGVDVAEMAEDGRLRRVIGFHDPLPEKP